MRNFNYIKVFNSPFKRPKLKWYFGKIAIGTPYFYPRRWIKPTQQMLIDNAKQDIADRQRWNKANEKYGNTYKVIPTIEELCEKKKNYKFPVPKKIGFDFVGLGYKTKWSDTDYRFEWGPLISFVFFKWQIAVMLKVPHPEHYWVCWLTYENDTDRDLLSTEARIKLAKEINPEVWTSSKGDGKKETICYWDKVLKDKWC
jgi:hypothetical protein